MISSDITRNNKVVIVDLDNCICDDSHRIKLIDSSAPTPETAYCLYHSEHITDSPRHCYLDGIHPDAHLVILTARPIAYYPTTIEWLAENGWPTPLHLCMRPEGNHQHSVDLKRDMLIGLQEKGIKFSNIEMAYDDRDDVLKMYSEMGIPATKLKIHDIPYPELVFPKPKFNVEDTTAAIKKHEEMLFDQNFVRTDSKEDRNLETVGDFFFDELERLIQSMGNPKPKTAADILDSMAGTFRERNKSYGNNYHNFGNVMAAIFPDGLELKTVEEFNRLGVFVQIISESTRYAEMFKTGHVDSAHDLGVYAAMLEELTRLNPNAK